MSQKNNQSFSEKFEELEEIVSYFEGSQLDVDESLAKFERGVELSKELQKYLETAQNKVEKIKLTFDE